MDKATLARDHRLRMKRGFDQLCAVAAGLDVVGDRWALLVVRELLFSPKRFGDLLRGLPGIGTNTLTTRLAELEASGVIAKRTTRPPLSLTVYELTERGRALTPTLVALARWGAAEILHRRPAHPLQPAWLGLAMLAFFDGAAAPKVPITVALVFPKGTLAVEIGRAGLRITEAEAPAAALTLTATSPEVVLGLLRGALEVGRARKRKELVVTGDEALVATFVAAFPLGPPSP